MEAFALKQIEKRKKQIIKQEKLEKSLVLSKDEVERLNVHFGCPLPPNSVRAIGRNQSAAIWWTFDGDDSHITTWEILRYRKNIRTSNIYKEDDNDENYNEILGKEWSYKGSIFLGPQDHKQYVIEGLTNDYLYCFTMKAKNIKGSSSESYPSEEVMIEAPLPAGWFRFFYSNTSRFYYANIKSKQSTWERPEKDPYFLDESIVVNFNKNEIMFLKELYDEEIINFKCVHIDRFNDILREIGEKRMTVPDIQKLFRGFAGHEERLDSWIDYMNIINYLKTEKIKPKKVINVKTNINLNIGKTILSAMTGVSIEEKNFGDWIIEYSSLADRRFFRNIATGEIRWDMPAEIRFYIPPKMETQLLQVFDYLQLETLKKYFSTLDVDSSGELSEKELHLLLSSLGAKVEEKKFNKLMKIADIDGNGTIEFSEFCWMIYQLTRQDSSGSWSEFSEIFGPIKFFNRRGTHLLKSNSIKEVTSESSRLLQNDLIKAGAFTVDMFGQAINKISSQLEIAMQDNFEVDSSISRRSSIRIQNKIKEIKNESSKIKTSSSKVLSNIKNKTVKVFDVLYELSTGKKRVAPIGPHGLFCFCGCRCYN